jgi:hypothetical protein
MKRGAEDEMQRDRVGSLCVSPWASVIEISLDRIPLEAFYLCSHVRKTAPSFILWLWKFLNTIWPRPPQISLLGGRRWEPILLAHSLHIRGKVGGAVYIIFQCLWPLFSSKNKIIRGGVGGSWVGYRDILSMYRWSQFSYEWSVAVTGWKSKRKLITPKTNHKLNIMYFQT